jgi:FdrA protein
MLGIEQAFAFMGTEMNKKTRASAGLLVGEAATAGPDDLVLVIQGEEEQDIKYALECFEKKILSVEKEENKNGFEEVQPRTIEKGLLKLTDANLAVISVPGEYAAAQAAKALNLNLNVHIFSDNVTVEDEVRLKELGKKKGLLVMGPDCGTAIINKIPICFANKVSQGSIGIVGASGTGIQQTTVIIERMGYGITHAIGTGGRDLSNKVEGVTTLMALEALATDPATEVIVLISKPPGENTEKIVIDAVKEINKPVIIAFLGKEKLDMEKEYSHIYFASDLEAAAAKAVALSQGRSVDEVSLAFPREDNTSLVKEETKAKDKEQKYIRGLYTGGSLADEAMHVLKKYVGDMYSNIPLKPEYTLLTAWNSQGHCIVDVGDDEFTRGKLHPMIDPLYRAERVIQEFNDPEVSVILCDVVIGYACHINPAKVLADAVEKARKTVSRHVTVIACVCGTENDPQNLHKQEEILRKADILVFPSNKYAAEVAGEIVQYSIERR